jgi:hypothetical protein
VISSLLVEGAWGVWDSGTLASLQASKVRPWLNAGPRGPQAISPIKEIQT